jgi:hypothetical protein
MGRVYTRAGLNREAHESSPVLAASAENWSTARHMLARVLACRHRRKYRGIRCCGPRGEHALRTPVFSSGGTSTRILDRVSGASAQRCFSGDAVRGDLVQVRDAINRADAARPVGGARRRLLHVERCDDRRVARHPWRGSRDRGLHGRNANVLYASATSSVSSWCCPRSAGRTSEDIPVDIAPVRHITYAPDAGGLEAFERRIAQAVAALGLARPATRGWRRRRRVSATRAAVRCRRPSPRRSWHAAREARARNPADSTGRSTRRWRVARERCRRPLAT